MKDYEYKIRTKRINPIMGLIGYTSTCEIFKDGKIINLDEIHADTEKEATLKMKSKAEEWINTIKEAEILLNEPVITDEEIDNLLREGEGEIDLELEDGISTDDNESPKLETKKVESALKNIFIFIFIVIAIIAGIAVIIALGPLWVIAILLFLGLRWKK